jgi:hypothetical protein
MRRVIDRRKRALCDKFIQCMYDFCTEIGMKKTDVSAQIEKLFDKSATPGKVSSKSNQAITLLKELERLEKIKEVVMNTAIPQGVPQDVKDNWYQEIAATISQKGSAKIAFVFAGYALIVNYSVKSDFSRQLMYSSRYGNAGALKSENLDSKFTHASLSNVMWTTINASFEI